MANQIYNQALGRFVEWYIRVDGSDPTNAVFLVIAWVTTETDAILKDLDDVAAVEANVNTAEATNTNYTRKSLDDTDLVAISDPDASDQRDLDIPDQTFTNILAGSNWTDLSIDYDSDSLAGTDANVVVGSWHDFAVTPDGSDITAQIAAAGFFRAS